MKNKYTVQRPVIFWVETQIEAESLAQALEESSHDFTEGNYIELEGTWEIDFSRYWVQTHDGIVFTEGHAPFANN